MNIKLKHSKPSEVELSGNKAFFEVIGRKIDAIENELNGIKGSVKSTPVANKALRVSHTEPSNIAKGSKSLAKSRTDEHEIMNSFFKRINLQK